MSTTASGSNARGSTWRRSAMDRHPGVGGAVGGTDQAQTDVTAGYAKAGASTPILWATSPAFSKGRQWRSSCRSTADPRWATPSGSGASPSASWRPRRPANDVVVVVSAMGDTTDDLLDLARQVAWRPTARARHAADGGERISNALVAMAIESPRRARPRSFTGSQAGVITTGTHGNAKIIDVTPGHGSALDEGRSSWSRGSRVSQDSKRRHHAGPRRLGHHRRRAGGGAERRCSARFTPTSTASSPPTRASVPNARRLDTVTFEEMLEMAAPGRRFMLRCVEYARRYGVPIHVRSSYSDKPAPSSPDRSRTSLEDAIPTGVAHDRSEAKVTVVGLPADVPGRRRQVFRAVADAIRQHRHGAAEHLRSRTARPTSPSPVRGTPGPPRCRRASRRTRSVSPGARRPHR